jgi:predicted DCC family thiol-disulfide oxidoreductase YuxK
LCAELTKTAFQHTGATRFIFYLHVSLIFENMKTLKNHLILFDEECPMCKVYTRAFVQAGMLDANGRAAYQNGMENSCPLIDKQRAANEIALVNLENGEVTYGIKSLFKVIGNAMPVFRPLFAFKPFTWLMGKVYAFIAYNRRVIIPAAKSGNSFQYQPVFKFHYRMAYLLFTWFCTGFILTRYAHLLTGFVPLGNAYREYFICGGQIVFQGLVISLFAREKLWNYLGNMMTISFAGSLLLLVLIGISHLAELPVIVFPLYFLGVAGLMFLEHIRRTKLMDLGWTLTVTWVLYRVVLLVSILNFR